MPFPHASTSNACNNAGSVSDDDDSDTGATAFKEARTHAYHSSDDDDDAAYHSDDDEAEDWHDPSELADLIEQAAKCKAEGNAHFTAQRNAAAIEAYKEGIAILPVHKPATTSKSRKDPSGKGKGREESEDSDDEDLGSAKKTNGDSDNQIREIVDDEDEKAFIEQGKISDEEKQLIELRGALWNNLAATQLRLSLYKEAAESATQALKDSPSNIKALQRRATANDKLDTWSSLTTALEDYNQLAKLSDTPKTSLPSIRQAQRTIPSRIEQRKTDETKEMMDKLKGLGNTFLGKFGMSTDNFQFVKDEKTGGYSMNFVQNPTSK